MSLKDKLKPAANWVAAVSSAAVLGSTHASTPSDTYSSTELLDKRVERGTIVNGKTKSERFDKWASMKSEKGTQTTIDAIQNEKIEIPHKDENGYVFETYEPNKGHTTESYYPNGVLQSKTGDNGDEAYYPDGSMKFIRTADGTETTYHPGGKKGKKKSKKRHINLMKPMMF